MARTISLDGGREVHLKYCNEIVQYRYSTSQSLPQILSCCFIRPCSESEAFMFMLILQRRVTSSQKIEERGAVRDGGNWKAQGRPNSKKSWCRGQKASEPPPYRCGGLYQPFYLSQIQAGLTPFGTKRHFFPRCLCEFECARVPFPALQYPFDKMSKVTDSRMNS